MAEWEVSTLYASLNKRSHQSRLERGSAVAEWGVSTWYASLNKRNHQSGLQRGSAMGEWQVSTWYAFLYTSVAISPDFKEDRQWLNGK